MSEHSQTQFAEPRLVERLLRWVAKKADRAAFRRYKERVND